MNTLSTPEVTTTLEPTPVVELVPHTDVVHLDKVWNEIEPMLMEYEEVWGFLYTIDWIKNTIMSGAIQVWILRDALDSPVKLVYLTQIMKYPQRDVLEVFFTCGEGLFKHQDLLEVVEQCAVRSGVEISKIGGRRGFERLLKRRGYRMENVTFTKWLINKFERIH